MGLLRPVTCILPVGSIVNPVYPAATGMRSLTCTRIQGMVVGAFSRAMPDRLPAGPAGGGGILNVRTTDSRTGRLAMASINPITGGGGGSSFEDGQDGSNSFLKNTPVEITESEVPIRVVSYELVPDSGGPGRYRGGLAAQMKFQMFTPNSVVTARNRDRVRFSSWGLEGGQPGATCGFHRSNGNARSEDLGNTDVVRCAPGDVLTISASGAGGWGDPYARPVQDVVRDVLGGKVSETGARAYGVVIVDGILDEAATDGLRAAPRKSVKGMVFDRERLAFEGIWSNAVWDRLAERLFGLPVEWRFFLKHEIFAAVNADEAASADPLAALERAYAAVLALYPQITADRMEDAA
jgi:N-methylhydantoinase B